MTDGARIASEPGAGVSAEGGREPAVRVVELTKDFAGGVRAMDGVTFDVPKGSSPASSGRADAARPRRSRSSRG
jgi:hypothetical protein